MWIQFCSNSAFTDFKRTTGLVTNRQGDGHAQAKFTAAQLAPFSGATVSIRWVLKSGGPIAYTTACMTVTIDAASHLAHVQLCWVVASSSGGTCARGRP